MWEFVESSEAFRGAAFYISPRGCLVAAISDASRRASFLPEGEPVVICLTRRGSFYISDASKMTNASHDVAGLQFFMFRCIRDKTKMSHDVALH